MPQGQVHPIREAYPAALNKEGIATNQLQISASIVRASLRLPCCARRLAAVANHFDGADGPE